MKPGDIVLTVIPQDEEQKIRPVLISKILPGYYDLLVCAVSTQLQKSIPNFDLILKDTDPAFTSTGLRASSVFRLASLAVLPPKKLLAASGVCKKICMINY